MASSGFLTEISWLWYKIFKIFKIPSNSHKKLLVIYQPSCLFLKDEKVSHVLVCSSNLLWAEHKFNCHITGLRTAEKMSMTMLVLVARALQQPMKTLKQWRKWFSIIIESLLERLLMMLAYRSAHAKQFLRMCYHYRSNEQDIKRIIKVVFRRAHKSYGISSFCPAECG